MFKTKPKKVVAKGELEVMRKKNGVVLDHAQVPSPIESIMRGANSSNEKKTLSMKKRNADAEDVGRGELGRAEEMLMINALLCGFQV